MRRIVHALVLLAALAVMSTGLVGTVSAAPLPDNCTKDKGTVTCTTFDGPGKNQGGVGTTTETETQGAEDQTPPFVGRRRPHGTGAACWTTAGER